MRFAFSLKGTFSEANPHERERTTMYLTWYWIVLERSIKALCTDTNQKEGLAKLLSLVCVPVSLPPNSKDFFCKINANLHTVVAKHLLKAKYFNLQNEIITS